MSYFALYRQYRPQYFREVIGQDHIVTTLKHQVQNNRIAHAYLFSGTRGTGKTTVAKIFARAVNCTNPDEGEPCGICPACIAAQRGNPDIIEIDAASNNGINEMRDLREKVRFAPLESKYKVYILDEAHMITHDAFNALLKTLEEPPSHVVFILATTEPQRLPATILSRCQRFEFHRIHTDEIIQHLQTILDANQTTMDEDGLHAIARAAQGGLRDALSITDQCLALCDHNHISYSQVLDVLGSMDQEFLFQTAAALIQENSMTALQSLNTVLQKGRDLGVFCNDLLQHFRSLMLICSAKETASSLLDCSNTMFLRYQEQAQQTNLAYLLRAVRELSKMESDMKWMTDPRILLESCFVSLCFPSEEKALPDLFERISRLEKKAVSLPNTNITPPVIKQEEPPIFRDEDIPPDIAYDDFSALAATTIAEPELPILPDLDDIPITIPSKPKEKPKQRIETFSDILLPEKQPATQNLGNGQEIFQAMLQKQSEAIRKIFTLYQWDIQWMDEKTLLLIAPANCLPTLVKSLSAQTDNLSSSIADQYPNIQIMIGDHSTKIKKQLNVEKPQGITPKQPTSSLLEEASTFFGSDYVTNETE